MPTLILVKSSAAPIPPRNISDVSVRRSSIVAVTKSAAATHSAMISWGWPGSWDSTKSWEIARIPTSAAMPARQAKFRASPQRSSPTATRSCQPGDERLGPQGIVVDRDVENTEDNPADEQVEGAVKTIDPIIDGATVQHVLNK